MNAPHGKEFIFQDGVKAKTILELVAEIEKLSDHNFHHFVTAHKNDFANWVDHVLGNKKLSDKLRAVHTKSDTIKIIKDDIKHSSLKGWIGGSIIKSIGFKKHGKDHHKDHDQKDKDSSKDVDDDTRKKDDIDTKIIVDKKEESEEKKMEMKASRQWFKFFSKSHSEKKVEKDIERLNDKDVKKVEHNEERQFSPELSMLESDKENHENTLWVLLYIALVILIILLLMYKLFI